MAPVCMDIGLRLYNQPWNPLSYSWPWPKTAQKCPCCDGWGSREVLPLSNSATGPLPRKTCHTCKGEGVLWS